MKDRKIILIGGAPTVGKSTIAEAVAAHLNVPWISTDQVQEIMRTVANPSEIPNLFSDEGYSGEKFLTEFSAQEIVRMEMEKGEATWPGVKKLIEEEYPWRKGFVVEGVAILPHLVARDFSNTPHVKAVFLVDEDADRMREVIFKRGLWDGARTYPDEVKEKEVEWATLFSHLLKADVEKYGYPWVEVRKQEDDTQAVLRKLDLG